MSPVDLRPNWTGPECARFGCNATTLNVQRAQAIGRLQNEAIQRLRRLTRRLVSRFGRGVAVVKTYIRRRDNPEKGRNTDIPRRFVPLTKIVV